MLFGFLTYLQSTHYFQKKTNDGLSAYPDPQFLPKEVREVLEEDHRYESSLSKAYDLSYQAVQRGYLGDCPTYTAFENIPLKDNYHFVRKYFHSAWAFYVLLFRLLSFKNPVKEIGAWFGTRLVKRCRFFSKPLIYAEWDSYDSKLLQRNPLVTVVIPTLNRYSVLKDVLHDFERQEYSHFEVLVIDQSDDFKREFYDDFNLNIRVIRQEEKALWLARNSAVKAAKGELIALSEDDVRVKPDWIRNHLKCLDFFGASVSAGVFYPEGQQIPVERSYFALATQFATGNALLYRDVFKKIGLFDRQFEKQRMGDGEFGMRLYLNGIKSISNPYASCIDIKAPTGGLRELGSWDAFRPSNFFAPRPIPSVVYFFRRYFGAKATRLALLRMVPLSLFSYKLKRNKFFLVLSALLAVLLIPLLFFQVFKSWRLASEKIEQGPMIDCLK